jgi:hypothetical protein
MFSSWKKQAISSEGRHNFIQLYSTATDTLRTTTTTTTTTTITITKNHHHH